MWSLYRKGTALASRTDVGQAARSAKSVWILLLADLRENMGDVLSGLDYWSGSNQLTV